MMRPTIALVLAVVTTAPASAQTVTSSPAASSEIHIDLLDPRIRIEGRYWTESNGAIQIGFPGSGFLASFVGTGLRVDVNSSSATSALTLIVDHGPPSLLMLAQGEQVIELAAGLPAARHIVEVYKRTEIWQGIVSFRSLALPASSYFTEAPPLPRRKLLFIGDSVTCGAAVAEDRSCKEDANVPNADPYHAFDMLLGRRLDAQTQLVCYGGRGVQRDYRGLSYKDGVLNAPDFVDLAIATDEPSTRRPWNLQQYIPDAVVVSLGTNDFSLQSTQPLDEKSYVADLSKLLLHLRAEYPQAEIFATEGAIVTDPKLRQYVREAVAATHDAATHWVPGEHYPGNGCNAHPTAQQHEQMADDLEPVLREALHW